MAKRTVTRWVSERFDPNSIGKLRSDPFNNRPIEIVVSENEGHDGEPEGKCPCADPKRSACCQGELGDKCCPCHPRSSPPFAGLAPCLSDWHKKAESATRERRVDGCVAPWTNISGGNSEFGPHSVSHAVGTCVPATLIIHEPVKEPTLVEAVEALIRAWGSPIGSEHKNVKALRAALAREKAKVTR